jgi:hypothetical protein
MRPQGDCKLEHDALVADKRRVGHAHGADDQLLRHNGLWCGEIFVKRHQPLVLEPPAALSYRIHSRTFLTCRRRCHRPRRHVEPSQQLSQRLVQRASKAD